MENNRTNDYEDMGLSVSVYLAMSGEQAIRKGCNKCLSPQFPESKRVYGMLRDIDNNLCVYKHIGWTTVICLEKCNIGVVLHLLYPTGVPEEWDYKSLINLIDGDLVWIIGFDS